MKRIILAAIFGVASLASIDTKAQVSLNINIGSQPTWGPTGYNHVDYYYLPDIESYYNVSSREYVYQNGNRWITSKSLPSKYRNYDLYNGYKVVMNSPKPYLQHNNNVKQYSRYKDVRGKQISIRDNKNSKGRGNDRYDDRNAYNKNDDRKGRRN